MDTTLHEPFVLFGYLAAVTSLELVTGIIILPQRRTVLVAKQAAEVGGNRSPHRALRSWPVRSPYATSHQLILAAPAFVGPRRAPSIRYHAVAPGWESWDGTTGGRVRVAEPTAATRRNTAICAAVAVGVIAAFLVPGGPEMLDLKVYRLGADALLHGADLYAMREPRTGLAFTYPPFAAMLFIPYALVPLTVAKAASLVVSLVGLFLIVHLTVRWVLGRAGQLIDPSRALRWSAPLTLIAITAHPVLDTLMFGQINLLTTALVLVDLLVLRGRWRGTLIGLATGVKLVSALFIVYFLVTRQFRAAGNAVLSFAATIAIGFAILPVGSYDFWTAHIFDPDRVGGIAYVTNQSILGVAARLLREPHPPSTLTFSLSVIAAVAALVAAARQYRLGNEFIAVCLVAVGSLLASPISWSHHWVWAIPCCGVLAAWAREHRGRWRWIAATVATVILWAGAMRFMPKAGLLELHHNLGQQVVTNAYAGLAAIFLAWAGARRAAPMPTVAAEPQADLAVLVRAGHSD